MKKIFLIGEFNSITKNLYNDYVEKFQIQLCGTEQEVIDGMLKVVRPDIFVVLCCDMGEDKAELIENLVKNYGNIPLIMVGTGDEIRIFEKYAKYMQVTVLYRPVTNIEILDTIYQCLNIRVHKESAVMVKKRILIIDDNSVQLRTMRTVLKKSYYVDIAKTFAEAMKIIENNVPDLIYLDYMMPDYNGVQVFEMLRENELTKYIPVVFLTGVNNKDKVTEALKMNPVEYILKPVTQEKLMEVSERYLGKPW